MKDESNTRKIIKIWMKACFERLLGAPDQAEIPTSAAAKRKDGEGSYVK